MASYSGFIRKAPTGRLQSYFEARGVAAPDGFDWSSDGRGTVLVRSIEELLADLPDLRQDTLKAELDLFASLSDGNGLTAAERICAGEGVDLEDLQGVQDVLLLLAVQKPHLIDRIAAEASLMRRTGGRNWSAFQFDQDGKHWALDDEVAQAAFLQDAIEILDLPDHRKREADWYKSIRVHPITGKESEIVQATLYVEERAESELAFGPSATLERQIVQKVLEVGIACDARERVVEICARGGKAVRDDYAASFARHFAPDADAPLEAPRREVMLDTLRVCPEFWKEPADGIERVEISSLDFFSTGGGFTKIEKRGEDETLHEFAERRFGAHSPLNAAGWRLTGATIRIVLAPKEGQRRRTLTVTLRAPNTTTLPNKTEKDRQFVFELLERWNLLKPPPQDTGFAEAAE